jgi:proteasome lid subunit RPN8/RPN11
MLKASLEAERLSNELNKTMRVLGWYHSHPHITVWPSHVGTVIILFIIIIIPVIINCFYKL